MVRRGPGAQRAPQAWAAAQRSYSTFAFLDPHNLTAICAVNLVYLLAVYLVTRHVKAHGPVSDTVMKPLMLLYNAVCVVLAGWVVYGIVYYKLFVRSGQFACNAPDLGTSEGVELGWYADPDPTLPADL